MNTDALETMWFALIEDYLEENEIASADDNFYADLYCPHVKLQPISENSCVLENEFGTFVYFQRDGKVVRRLGGER